jgi:hypothetical protein
MTQLQADKAKQLRGALTDTWSSMRGRSATFFKFVMAVVFMGLMCDLVVLVSLFAWPAITHLSEAQIAIVVAVDLVLVLVVGPIAGVMLSKRLWAFADNYVRRLSENGEDRQQ